MLSMVTKILKTVGGNHSTIVGGFTITDVPAPIKIKTAEQFASVMNAIDIGAVVELSEEDYDAFIDSSRVAPTEDPAEGEAEAPVEGEAEAPVEGEAEAPVEGEAEAPAEAQKPLSKKEQKALEAAAAAKAAEEAAAQ